MSKNPDCIVREGLKRCLEYGLGVNPSVGRLRGCDRQPPPWRWRPEARGR
ncbi:hypothetical protein L665_03717 [Ralstonia solanacearum SD54]|nr:hypothetical protein F504_2553 [Ralstonia pseudosolanacearum FQY_4]ESS47334.1 hypothetical protein L665_03717 [Ralstonia solanacearum SD54]